MQTISSNHTEKLPTHPHIGSGPNAGKLRPITDIVIDGLTRARSVAIKLKRNGFTVINCITDSTMPTVQIQADSNTQELIRFNLACYYKWCTFNGVRERHGQFHADGVRVLWIERGF